MFQGFNESRDLLSNRRRCISSAFDSAKQLYFMLKEALQLMLGSKK